MFTVLMVLASNVTDRFVHEDGFEIPKLPDGPPTFTNCGDSFDPRHPFTSVTSSSTLKLPAVRYMLTGSLRLEVWPSPNVHCHFAISGVDRSLNAAVNGGQVPVVLSTEKSAIGLIILTTPGFTIFCSQP